MLAFIGILSFHLLFAHLIWHDPDASTPFLSAVKLSLFTTALWFGIAFVLLPLISFLIQSLPNLQQPPVRRLCPNIQQPGLQLNLWPTCDLYQECYLLIRAACHAFPLWANPTASTCKTHPNFTIFLADNTRPTLYVFCICRIECRQCSGTHIPLADRRCNSWSFGRLLSNASPTIHPPNL